MVALLCLGAGPSNLSVDEEATRKLSEGDLLFLEAFDVYSAGTEEAPLALLLDRRGDGHRIASYLWGSPLCPEEVLYAIKRLEDQHREPSWCLPLPPAALRVVNLRGEVLGYVYTSLREIFMQRKAEEVKVYLPDHVPCEDGQQWRPPLILRTLRK